MPPEPDPTSATSVSLLLSEQSDDLPLLSELSESESEPESNEQLLSELSESDDELLLLLLSELEPGCFLGEGEGEGALGRARRR
jgi:hypothetical protein